jgi:glycosyltransferase involved in cell wall biosynthesis
LSTATPVTSGLTIVIPYWDLDPQILLDAVGSLADQGATYRVIVVDNASAVPIPPLPPNVEVHRLPSRVSVGVARNAGLALVDTSHVLFLDADDQLFPGSIPFLLGQLEACPDAVASIGRAQAWRPDPTVPARYRFRHLRRRFFLRVTRLQRFPRILGAVNTIYMILQPSAGVVRVDAVRRAGGFSSDEAEEDWVLSALLPFYGQVIAGRQYVRRYRIRAGSLNRIKSRDWRISAGARREMRRRLRRDPAVPLLIRASTPLLAVLHSRPLLHELRRRLRRLARRLRAAIRVRGVPDA